MLLLIAEPKARIVVWHETVPVKFAAGKTIPRQVPFKGIHPQLNNCSLILITHFVNTSDQRIEADIENLAGEVSSGESD